MKVRSWRTVAPFLVGLASFGLLAVANHARGFDLWRNYALSGLLLGLPVTAVLWRYDVRVPSYIQSAIVAGLLLHYGGGSLGSPDPYRMGLAGTHGINGAYHKFEWWDNLTHAVGIGAGAMAIAYLLELYQLRRGLRWRPGPQAILAFLAGLAAGVGVELYEYLGKSAFQTIDQGGYTNTMTDLQFNALGAAAGAVLAVTVDRTLSWRGIRQRWGEGPADAPPHKVPPAMAGFIAFVTIPAAATLFLAVRFLGQDVAPADDRALYDPALRLLLAGAAAGAAVGPATGAAVRLARRRAA